MDYTKSAKKTDKIFASDQKNIFIPLSYITKNIRSWKKQPILHLTSCCASQTAPEAQRKRNIRNAETSINFKKQKNMKQQIILWISTLLLLTAGAGCKKDVIAPEVTIEKELQNEDSTSSGNSNSLEVTIIKKLPKITAIGNHKESKVIRSEKELKSVFTEKDLKHFKDLQQIDFSKHTLLLGYGTYGNQVTNMEHSFVRTGSNAYTYLLKVDGDATQPDVFRYGILVDKLAQSAKVTFKIEPLHI
ncbi:hypothetical protein [Tannerella forsythia]|nr:hypothetical protein CLI86_05080 [Tannerella forsythia]